MSLLADVDLDEDGRDDLVVSANARGTGYPGAVYVYWSGLTAQMRISSSDARWEASTAGTQLGYALAGGDVDGDGDDDLLLCGIDTCWLARGPVEPGGRSLDEDSGGSGAGSACLFLGSGL